MATVTRKTRETDIETTVWLDEPQSTSINTGIGFLDHMLEAVSKHSNISLQLNCQGDLDVDGHHTSEDCALALGEAMDQALGSRIGIRRFGSAYVPMDEALARVVDFQVALCSGEPRSQAGTYWANATENITHVFQSLAGTSCECHVDCLRGDNDHHCSEAAFKALALALKNRGKNWQQ